MSLLIANDLGFHNNQWQSRTYRAGPSRAIKACNLKSILVLLLFTMDYGPSLMTKHVHWALA